MTGSPAATEPTTAPPVVAFKKRGARRPKENLRKREKPDSSDSDSDDEVLPGRKAKRRQGLGAEAQKDTPAEAFQTIHKADRTVDLSASNDATRERARIGPAKTSTNVRSTTVTDYAPDVCKDYKQTGFCGFGDNCKFLHDRSDYKQGWQLDKEWESVTKGKTVAGTVVASADRENGVKDDDDDEDAGLEDIPFACFICKGDYKSPIVTRCSHYFCESCALKRYRENPRCAACNAGTNGVFNTARDLNAKLKKKKEREARIRQERIEAGEEVSSEEEDD
ncbi:related to N.crassa uvs2 protein [Cephalotrichum gorgonifer]|uniref:Pre-mRNA-splicing factor CWC24 n=1 Tax=Cephalotrichum gorgonifer TaxID=2041049 RepID=A0AAE8N904_9PEZI|nr:related to N.crassa uvs2 protein [Cephalotrichum gorgonifer]